MQRQRRDYQSGLAKGVSVNRPVTTGRTRFLVCLGIAPVVSVSAKAIANKNVITPAGNRVGYAPREYETM